GTSAQLTEEIGTALIQRAEQLLQGPPEEFAAGLSELQTTLVNASLALRHRARLNALLADLQKAARRQQKAEAADAADIVKQRLAEVLATAPRHGETTVVVVEMPDVPVEQLKMGADLVKQKCGSAAVLFGATERPGEGGAGVPASQSGGKVVLLAAMTPDLIKKGLKAGDLVRAIAPIVGGGGGGPPTMAQAGGKQPEKLGEALAAGAEWVKAKL
ncbi:MAG TPA: DHHA1 domain-containing protein, partial [Phycisphaerae bacterium]|nr:DHHA1 domain-containing protein [Phycisphaerae bacterium]